MLKIRDFARLAEVSMTTLRYYDEIGLLKPIQVDPETGYRFYTMDQLPHLHRILAFKELGLGLTQIAELLDEGVSPLALQGMLRLRQGPITGVLLHPTTGDLAEQADWIDIMLKRYGVKPIDHLLVVHTESDDECTPGSVEIVAPVDGRDADRLSTRSEGRLTRCELPGFPHMASTLHHGHPSLALPAYQALGTWMENNAYTIVGPRRKIRLRREDNLNDALTEIQFPVEKVP